MQLSKIKKNSSKNIPYHQLNQALCKDRHFLWKSFQNLPESSHPQYEQKHQFFKKKLSDSIENVEKRVSDLPEIQYPPQLPISQKREDIIEAIQKNQVVIITGETGSGKTTQIPKMCLSAGLGIRGKVGCTQPRRIAATSLSQQIAKELNSNVGEKVGYKIRFSDQTQDSTYIKLMTDGILLAEIQRDPYLNEYEVIVIDEAHERTLNIDFLLGYLRQLLEKRKDLKLIVTSATIDVEKFAAAFPQKEIPNQTKVIAKQSELSSQEIQTQPAPIIEVSGRLFPVELRYHPIDELLEEKGELSVIDLVQDAVEEVLTESNSGDILVFLTGEQEIKEGLNRLQYLTHENCSILPLYARLSRGEQNRIFEETDQRKIILSTNIAETSITIPKIRFVIDSGLGRISRYHSKSGTKGLPIEAISQSSANQRKGRCGRVSNGICIRLYSEEDFNLRSEFTSPEIQRSNLADVILRMHYAKLGKIEHFPFIDPPESSQIKAGYKILTELGALKNQTITRLGRQIAEFPVDPRTARMILQAKDEGVIYPVLIIAAGISIQDPRIYPKDADKGKAEQSHAQFKSKESDLMSLYNLWEHYHNTWEEIKTQNKMRKFCKNNFLSFQKMREWREIHQQLTRILKEKDWNLSKPDTINYDAIHQSITAGYLSNIALREQTSRRDYLGTRNKKFTLFPASGQYSRKHDWIVAIELIETSKLFAHQVAKIDPEWLERLGGDLCKLSWSNPHWEKKTGRVVAIEKVTLLGLTVVEARKINYGRIDRQESTEIFIRHALVDGQFNFKLPFFEKNQKLIEDIEVKEHKSRKRNLLVDDESIYHFYKERIPVVTCLKDLQKLIKEKGGDKFLCMEEKDLLLQEPEKKLELFPDTLNIGDNSYPLTYLFEPDHADDGVTLQLPYSAMQTLQQESFEYLVPGLLQEKVTWLLKNLIKSYRKQLVPIPEKAEKIWEEITSFQYSTNFEEHKKKTEQGFYGVLSETVFDLTKIHIPEVEWKKDELPDYLKFNFATYKPESNILTKSRDLSKFQNSKKNKAVQWSRLIQKFEKHDIIEWSFDKLTEKTLLTPEKEQSIALWGYSALVAQEQTGLKFTICKTKEEALQSSVSGISALLRKQFSEQVAWVEHELSFSLTVASQYTTLNMGVNAQALQNKFAQGNKKENRLVKGELTQDTFFSIQNHLF
ncbi:MAG: ATP-dependent helicase HrpA, partial [bacterium]